MENYSGNRTSGLTSPNWQLLTEIKLMRNLGCYYFCLFAATFLNICCLLLIFDQGQKNADTAQTKCVQRNQKKLI